MGEDLYRPVIKEGHHLVKSKSNPNRVRGQSRDSENKNPDIIEWEPVEERETREELLLEIEKDLQESELQKQRNISAGLEVTDSFLRLMSENPEAIRDAYSLAKTAIHFVANEGKKLAGGSKKLLRKLRKSKLIGVKGVSQYSTDISKRNQVENTCTELYDGVMKDEKLEDMSIEDARALVIDTLGHYINMRKNIDRLSKAKINDSKVTVLDMNQVITLMDAIIIRYPALMDEETSDSILNILSSNANLEENRKFKEVLRINDNYSCNTCETLNYNEQT